jgi:hypothetical protein
MRTACLLLLALCALQDPAKDLKSKEIQKRLAAVDALGADEKGEKALLGVLKDKKEDWEVLVQCATVLAAHGSAAAVDDLAKAACKGPIRQLRLAASRTLGKIAPKAGAEALLKETSGDGALHALQSLDALLTQTQEQLELKPLEKLAEKAKDPAVRAAAVRASVRNHRADRPAGLEKALAVESVAQQCAALDVCGEEPRADCAPALIAFLGKSAISDLAERRAERALALAPPADLSALAPLSGAKEGAPAARCARVIAALPAAVTAAARLQALGPCLEHKQVAARAAAARALTAVGGKDARTRAAGLFESDKEPRVRYAALDSLVALSVEADEADLGQRLCTRLPLESDAGVRERIAVQLGRKGLVAAVEPLSRALDDPQWPVAVCAAVSLGRTQSGPTVDRLTHLIKKTKDWKLRGTATTGLGQSYVSACLAPLA